jgi:hypothetical protein
MTKGKGFLLRSVELWPQAPKVERERESPNISLSPIVYTKGGVMVKFPKGERVPGIFIFLQLGRRFGVFKLEQTLTYLVWLHLKGF